MDRESSGVYNRSNVSKVVPWSVVGLREGTRNLRQSGVCLEANRTTTSLGGRFSGGAWEKKTRQMA